MQTRGDRLVTNENKTATNPVGLLKDEFASGDVESRLRAASRLKILAQALGPDRTCSELLPAITGKLLGGGND